MEMNLLTQKRAKAIAEGAAAFGCEIDLNSSKGRLPARGNQLRIGQEPGQDFFHS